MTKMQGDGGGGRGDDSDDKDKSKEETPEKKKEIGAGDDSDDDCGKSDTQSPPGQSGADLPPDMKPFSATTSACSASTIATAPITPMTTVSALTSPGSSPDSVALRSGKNNKNMDLTQQRQRLTQRFYLFAVLSAISFSAFLYLYLPFMALLALTVYVSTTCLVFFSLYQRFLLEYDNLVQGRGIGDHLSESLYVLLAETTLHEWLLAPGPWMEYRHLLLYYIPYITNEQLEAYVDRLPPRHRDFLRRRGLGQFLGDNFMRLLLGDTRWTPQVTSPVDTPVVASRATGPLISEQQETEIQTPSPPVPAIASESLHRRLYESDDEDSGIGLDVTDADLTRGMDDRQTWRFARWIGLTRSSDDHEVPDNAPASSQQDTANRPETSDNLPTPEFPAVVSRSVIVEEPYSTDPGVQLHHEEEIEGDVLADALFAMAQSYVQHYIASTTRMAAQGVDYVSTAIIGTGIGLTTISASVGLLGVWYGAYHPRGVTALSPRFPSSRSLLSIALYSGATSGIMMLIRSGVRRVMSDAQGESAKEPEEDKGETEKK